MNTFNGISVATAWGALGVISSHFALATTKDFCHYENRKTFLILFCLFVIVERIHMQSLIHIKKKKIYTNANGSHNDAHNLFFCPEENNITSNINRGKVCACFFSFVICECHGNGMFACMFVCFRLRAVYRRECIMIELNIVKNVTECCADSQFANSMAHCAMPARVFARVILLHFQLCTWYWRWSPNFFSFFFR